MTHSHNLAHPRDYLTVPALFGRNPSAEWLAVPAVDEVAVSIAMAQHRVALALYRQRDPSAARRVSRGFGFSVQSWSDYMLGKAWLTPAAWAAAATLLLEHGRGE